MQLVIVRTAVTITHRAVFTPSWMGDRGPLRELRFESEVFTGTESSGEQLPSWKYSLWRPLIVVGWMGSSTDGVQLRSFSCSTPASSSSSSSSSIAETWWSLARVFSRTCPGGRASSRCRLWTCLGRNTVSVSGSQPGRVGSVWVGSVCVDLSNVAGLDSVAAGFPMWPLALVTVLSDSWLEKVQRLRSTTATQADYTQYLHNHPQNTHITVPQTK